MRFKTNKKAVMNCYKIVVEVPFCYLQNLLKHSRNMAYVTHSVNGWRCDIYEVFTKEGKPVAVSTGYGPFGNVHPGYDLCKKYDLMAERMEKGTYEEEKAKLNEMIGDFLEEAIGGDLNV